MEHPQSQQSTEARAAVQRHRLRNILRTLNEAAHDAATNIAAIEYPDQNSQRHASITAEEIAHNAERNREMIEALILSSSTNPQ